MRTRDRNWVDSLPDKYPNAYIEWYPGCKEPGYDDKPVMLANWNNTPNKVFDRLERLGFSCEWSDEWCSCSNCGYVVRTSPDSYHWQGSFWLGDGELLCLDCLGDSITDYFESLENNPKNAVTWPILNKYPLENYGYTLVKDGYENGLHEFMNDDPKKILMALQQENLLAHKWYIFAMTDQSQFYVTFAVYEKTQEEEV